MVEVEGTPATLLRWKMDSLALDGAPPEGLLVPEPPTPPSDGMPMSSPTSSCPPNVLSLARFFPPSNCSIGPPLPALVPLPAPQKVDPSTVLELGLGLELELGLELDWAVAAGRYPGREEERVARMRREATEEGRTAGPKYLRRAAWNALLELLLLEVEVAADAIVGLSVTEEEGRRARPTAAMVWRGRRIRASRYR